MDARGKCELVDGYPAVRHRDNGVYLVRPEDRLITFFPSGMCYMDLRRFRVEDSEPQEAFGFTVLGGVPEGYTVEEWAIPFIKGWDGVIVFNSGTIIR